MANFDHHGDYQTVNHYHSSYHTPGTHTSTHTHGPEIRPIPTARSQQTRIVEPSGYKSPSVRPPPYNLCIRSPDRHGEGSYSQANSEMPWWFTKQAVGYRSSRAAAAHESMLEDLHIEKLRAAKNSALQKLQSAQYNWERYHDEWRQMMGDEPERGARDMPDWWRGASGDREGSGAIAVERRRGGLVMVKRKKRSAEKNGRRGGAKERILFI